MPLSILLSIPQSIPLSIPQSIPQGQGQDPASLSRLHDIVTPPPIAAWPPAAGWWVLLAALAATAVTIGLVALRHWRADAYRRAALRELDHTEAAALPALVKRTALAAYPRARVAGLSGEAWLGFLDATGGNGAFCAGPGRDLARLAYAPDAQADAQLFDAVRRWIRTHRREPAC